MLLEKLKQVCLTIQSNYDSREIKLWEDGAPEQRSQHNCSGQLCILTNKSTSPSEDDRTLKKACVEQPIYFWQNEGLKYTLQNCCHLQLRIIADDGNRNTHFQSAPKHLTFIKSVASHHSRFSSSPLGVPGLPLPISSTLIAGLPAFLKNQLHHIDCFSSINYEIFMNSTMTILFFPNDKPCK